MRNKLMLLLIVGVTVLNLFAVPTVAEVKARQRYPWNGLVDIDVTVAGMEAGKIGLISCVASNLETKTKLRMETIKYGDKSVGKNLEVTIDGTHRFVWDAKADIKEGRFERTQIYAELNVLDFNGHEGVQLWENGPYWATCNVGAEKPEEAGYYFWWGDTIGYKRENDKWVASDGSMSGYSFTVSFPVENSPTIRKDNAALQSEGWIGEEGCLTFEHDAATAHWGGNWRMPMQSELEQLNSNCTWTRTQRNGTSGYEVRGKDDYANAWIFIPAAGYGEDSLLSSVGSGYYWSSTPNASYSNASWSLTFGIYDTHYLYSNSHRISGRSVRAVLGFTK